MTKTFFTLQNAKPLLLASAVALALTACGGSGGSNAPTPDQPSKPIAPENSGKPESDAKPQQPPQNNNGHVGNGNSGSGNAGGSITPPKKPDSPKDPAPSPKDPAPSPKDPQPQDPELKDPGNILGPVDADGAGVITYTQYDAPPQYGGTLIRHHEKLVQDAFNHVDTFEVKSKSLVLKPTLATSIYDSVKQKVELKFPAAGEKEAITVDQVGIAYRAKKFGYQEAQAFHYYGLIGGRPFGVAYSIGKSTSVPTVQQLQGNIVYKGAASFLEKGVEFEDKFPNPKDPVLESGNVSITLNTAEKTLDAVITLPQRFNKSYSFDKISYKDSSVFERAEQDKSIHGYFYGNQAQHIGGAYYVPEGAGAFITEKQQ